ncbi:MAG TPA: glycoside hydrolase family 3 C-terminal domain-containing protein [Lacibacter sp.]|nr:glycoside hydrolase family 3 C-terminal domain-containing protein [Lacibacter sp.]HMO89227.1 glycoside hydrolase family 3 C-terminal domain-containing protein [Lacibacter sp.]HMP88088.1 glycoside hydrolase family 3 C-terminal domain-containing protein [Lacibacter sp.]
MKRLFALLGLLLHQAAGAQEFKNYPMWNHRLPVEQRVNDLISRLTLEEKVAQMLNSTPAVPRLGIPAYDWWNEVLHGVARTPFHTTVFPQAIGMAATWDTTALNLMAHYSALEGRAVFNKATALGRNNERYLGLTYWTPNINIFRDPRWGRGQETYGEDPFLTAMLGKAFVRGLQGEHPFYLKAAACAKHYAVHSGPEPSRHVDNFNPKPTDLWNTYLPAFRELIVNAKVAGVMCAYNAVNTEPCCANNLLMNEILRKRWQFTGYVTSDCWGLDDFYKYHKTHPDATNAAVDALLHGTDIECGNYVYVKLLDAVKKGLVPEEQINVSLRRLFTIRYRLGLFDPAELVPFTQTPESALEAPEHKAHALQMARQSIVLLKNSNNVLPLSKNIKRIAVVGPNADNRISILGNYNGIPSRIVTVLDGIREKLGPGVEVIYEKAINFTNDTLLLYNDISRLYRIDGRKGVKAEYFNNTNISGPPAAIRYVDDIDFYWAEGQTPAPGIGTIHYSARYTSYLTAEKDEVLYFEAEGDDGYRIFVDDKKVVDAWLRNRWGTKQFSLPVKKGQSFKIVVEMYQTEGNAAIRLKSGQYVKTDFTALANRLANVDAIIFAGGISPQLEGEEMPVNAPGFNGGDRTSILLPAVQTELLKTLHTTGKPVVFVMMTGSAIAVPWEHDNLSAILNSWYGGQSAGTAIADVLFGDYNPAGRLPVTFYRSDSDLPSFTSYDMTNRTYRYFKGTPLYPFGYGLSYSRFTYKNLSVPKTLARGNAVTVTFVVTNNGGLDGEEVVQLYLTRPATESMPQRELRGFQRIFLKAGETQTIRFTLSPAELSVADGDGNLQQLTGTYSISVGGGQPGVQQFTTSNTLQKNLSIR